MVHNMQYWTHVKHVQYKIFPDLNLLFLHAIQQYLLIQLTQIQNIHTDDSATAQYQYRDGQDKNTKITVLQPRDDILNKKINTTSLLQN